MAFDLRPGVVHFVDRVDEQARAFRAIAEWRGRDRPMCVVLSGLAGAGKTELALRIARKLRGRHPDIEAVLYVDLDELRVEGAASATDVLGELLRALDVTPEWLEVTLRGRQRQYSVKTDGRRLVVIIDNARYGSEVVPLLPSSETAVVIVTSQARLFDLEAGAAVEVAVGPLEDADAMELLELITEDSRLAAEPETAIELVRMCSGLPGAVHAAGHLLRKHELRSLARVLSELAVDLQERGLPDVEKVWDAAYGALSANAALLYRLLADFPGPSFTAEAVTALLGQGKDAADDALDELGNASLLDLRAGRMRLPELLRAHAKRCARRDAGSEEGADGRLRILDWFLRQAQRADTLAAGERMRLAEPWPPLPDTPDVQFADKGQALRWLEAERHVLNGCVRAAYAYGHDEAAWALCEPLWTHYLDFPHYEDVVDAFATGLAAAQRAGDVAAVARMRCQVARPYWEQGRFDEAGRELEAARNAAATLGTSELESMIKASVVEFRGMLHGARGEWSAAAAEFEASRQVHEAITNEYGVMILTYRLGQAVAELGETHRAAALPERAAASFERAAALLEQAHAEARALQRERMTARTGVALAGVLHRLGRADQAQALYMASLESARERDSTYDQARILRSLATVAEEAGDSDQARRHRELADALRDRSGGLA